jgi:hypothetical protein
VLVSSLQSTSITTTIRPSRLVYPRNSFIAVNHTLYDDHPSHPLDHHWLLNASNAPYINRPCRRAHLTAPTVRARVPMHLVRQLHPHPTLPLPRAYTQTPVARHAAKHTANHLLFTMVVVRSTIRIRRRPRRMEDTTNRPDADRVVVAHVFTDRIMLLCGRGGYHFPSE